MGKLVVLPTVLLSLSAAVANPVSSEGYDLKDLTDTIGSQHSISASLSPYFGAFDNDVTSGGGRWLASGNTASVIWDFGADTPQSVDAYRLMPAWASYYEDARNPKDFELLAKNEDPDSEEGWTVINSQTNQSMSGSTSGSQWYFYKTDPVNRTPYRYYKFHVSANNGSTSYVGIQEVELFRLYTPDPVFGACTVTKGADGYLLSVRMSANSGTVKACLKTESGSTVKEVSVGEVSADDEEPVEVQLQASALGIDARKLYRLSLVATNDDGTAEFDFPEILYFGSGVQESDYVWRAQFALSEGIATALGEETLTDVPVLVRLSADIPNFSLAAFSDSARRDLLFRDERGTVLSHEIDSVDSEGGLLAWVKVPELTASTVLTCCYGGPVNPQALNAADTWSGYVGVWHLNGHDASNTTADATGHGLDATGADFTGIDGPFGSPAAQTTKAMTAPDFEPVHQVGGTFSCSLWFKKPTQGGEYSTFVSKKTGLNWDASTGWYLEMSQSATTAKFISSGGSAWSMTSVPTVKTNWNHFHVVCNGSTVKVYLNGNMTPALSNSTSVKASSVAFSLLGASQQGDEFRLKKTADSALRASIEYKAMADVDFLSTEGFVPVDATATVFGAPSASVSNEGAVLVTIPVEGGSGDVSVIYNETTEVALGSVTTPPCTFTDTPAVPADTIWSFTAKGVNQKGTVVEKACESGVLNGVVNATATRNADERDLVEGVFTITRPSNGEACTYPLSVNLSWGGTAEAGKNYEDTLPSSVTIPAGAASVTVTVVPMLDSESTEDETLLLTVAPGPYRTGTAAEMTILNLSTPTGFNTWVAKEAGRASDAANWSAGHAPLATEKVLFDGRFSTAKCTWDAEATHTVAAWKQGTGYAETIEFDTEFPSYEGATFALFTVTGDCEILSGGWTCRGNYANYGAATESATAKLATKRWCLNVSVAGDLTVAEGASINVTGKGFGHPGNQNSPCYGGMSFDASLVSNPYGSITEPFDPGMGCRSQGDQNRYRSATGGGAVKLVVGGTVTLDGSILAVGTGDLNIARSAGTGGSIWIDATQIAGTGTIDASGAPTSVFTSDQGVAIGSGGRVALYTKSTLALARDRILCGGSGYAVGSALAKTKIASCGTIFIKDQSMANGVLVLKQPSTATSLSANARVPLMDETTTLDAIELSGRVLLSVDAGKTLVLPNGFASVTSSSTAVGENGLTLRGGTVDVGSGDQTISGWMLEPVVTYAFPANVSLVHAGAIGILRRNFCGTGDAQLPPRAISFSVAGNLSVDETSAVSVANAAAYSNYLTGQKAGWHGGWTTYSDKSGDKTDARELTYGSVFDPVSPGSSPTRYFPAGGAVVMTVAGELSLAGSISADGPFSDNQADNVAPSSGGSINLTAGAISGAGSITACGGSGRYSYAGGGAGGRIAVKLTRANATLPEGLTINAQGRYGYAFNAKANKLGSAGTVYVQTAANGEKGGTISISNWPDRKIADFTSATVIPTTPIVAFVDGDAAADFKRSSLVVTNNAIAEVSVETLSLKSLAIAEDSKLDLNGRRLVVKAATLGGERLYPGSYKASDAAVSAFVMDSAGTDGTLEVSGGGFKFILR